MAVKWQTPGIRFTEIDNTIQTNADPGIGIGAIVMKSNKGPVNMRVLSRNYNEFVEHFGEPEALDDYGHFAAENYLAVSNQLLAVRATMGDEEYSQIQFSYPEASTSATNMSEDTCVFKYVDNLGDNNLDLVQQLSAVTVLSALLVEEGEEDHKSAEWLVDDGGPISGFTLNQKADWSKFRDIRSDSDELIIYKQGPNNIQGTGVHVTYPSLVDVTGTILKTENKLIFNDYAFNEMSANCSEIAFSNTKINDASSEELKEHTGVKVTMKIPAEYTLNNESFKLSFIGEYSAVSGWGKKLEDGGDDGVFYKDIFTEDNFYPAGKFSGFKMVESSEDIDENDFQKAGYGYQKAMKLQLLDWEDVSTRKTYYVNEYDLNQKDYASDDEEIDPISGAVSAIRYREYGMEDDSFVIAGEYQIDDKDGLDAFFCSAISGMYANGEIDESSRMFPDRSPRKVCFDMANEYGCSDPTEIMNLYYLRYFDVLEQEVTEKIVKSDVTKKNAAGDMDAIQDKLFWLFAKNTDGSTTIKSVFDAKSPDFAYLPIQDDYEFKIRVKIPQTTEYSETIVKRNSITATPSSYIFNSTDRTYIDGYTILTQTEDEPGNGDIENYNSNFDNQLVIASIGPGKYGNDIGVSIITTECSEIAALQHPNAFNWKYTYDDEDQVNDDVQDYTENDADLTWKKVFRINVYVKTKTQTAKGAWGSGMEALLKDPVESWFVSSDPYAKDAEGNSLYAPNVINGHSEYIYVSRSSIALARNGKGQYEQPNQTYSIYQLTGGKNSTKNNIQEKTACLSLYTDRQKADFDILFNTEAIESYRGGKRMTAMQKKIAQIAAARTMDIGVVQTTSKAAKTCKEMLSETKMFTFNNGTYVACYGGYDKYYNGTLASWIYLPKSVAGACAMAYCDNFAYPWMAPAGVQRGGISYTAGQLKRLTDDEVGQLYDNQCNTSRDCGGYGEVLWGQKTALKKVSALNRINVRRCLNYIEKNLENALTPYLFQQNTPNTRSSAKNVIDSFLNRVKSAEGIISFSTSVTQDPEDAHIMNVNIHVIPAEAIEFIDIKINVDRNSGVTVAEG